MDKFKKASGMKRKFMFNHTYLRCQLKSEFYSQASFEHSVWIAAEVLGISEEAMLQTIKMA